MEFFAAIGLITTIYLIYKFVLSWKRACGYDEESEDQDTMETDEAEPESASDIVKSYRQELRESRRARMNSIRNSRIKVPECFVFDRNDNALYLPVFKPLPRINNQEAISVNLELKMLGSYVRLYYHLISEFSTDDSPVHESEDVRYLVYQAEMIRREIYSKIFENGIPEQIDDDAEVIFRKAQAELSTMINLIQGTYEHLRKKCMENHGGKACEKLNRIYSILNAEKIHFRGDPHWYSYYERMTEPYLATAIGKAPAGYERPKFARDLNYGPH